MKNIVLIGFMGTGKTSVGKKLAEKLGREFLELDDIIEERESIKIAKIFEQKGEEYFRQIEKEVVKEASQREAVVISAGGGAVLDMENFNNLRMNGILICLEASPNVIFERTRHMETRPLLNVPDQQKRIRDLLAKREAYYKLADFYINTDYLTVDEVVERIEELVKREI